jgi:hypothetical protein
VRQRVHGWFVVKNRLTVSHQNGKWSSIIAPIEIVDSYKYEIATNILTIKGKYARWVRALFSSKLLTAIKAKLQQTYLL